MCDPNQGERMWGQAGLQVPHSHQGLEGSSVPWPQTPGGFTCIPKGCGVSCEEEIDRGGPFGWKGTPAPCTLCLGRACLCPLTAFVSS